jgi:hypothetical protein
LRNRTTTIVETTTTTLVESTGLFWGFVALCVFLNVLMCSLCYFVFKKGGRKATKVHTPHSTPVRKRIIEPHLISVTSE